jgi:putative aldouronate transport system permease protein
MEITAAGKMINKKSKELKTAAKPKTDFFNYMLKNKALYIMASIGLIYIIIFRYLPMYGVLIAFKDFDIVKGVMDSDWIGWDNFRYLLSFPQFYTVLKNSILISLYRILWGFPAPVLLAIVLNEVQNKKFKSVTQTVIYLPHFISWVVIAGLIINFTSVPDGVINALLGKLGIDPIAFLQKRQYFRGIIVISDIWKEAGWGTIIYLAAITGISGDLYEAAVIDGANRIQRIIHITIPGILSTVIVMLIMRMGSVLKNGFEQIFLLYNAMVYDVADVFETFTYRVGMIEGRYGFATAVGLFQSVVGLIFVMTSNKLAKKFGDGGLW